MPEDAIQPQFKDNGRGEGSGLRTGQRPGLRPSLADEPQSISAEEAVALAVELRDRADALVALCSRISGIPFDPDDDDALALDAWFSEALDALQRTVRRA